LTPPWSQIWAFVARWYSVPLLLACWEIVSRSGLVQPRLVPSLLLIGQVFWHDLMSGVLIYHSAITLYRALGGFLMAVVAGCALGAAMARNRLVDALFEPIFSFGFPIPRIALYPIFIFIFGLGDGSKLALVFLEGMFVITLQTYQGIRAVSNTLVWAGSSMGASKRQLFWRVLLPAAMPAIFTGFRIALPVALIIVVSTEIIGESVGLGYYIEFASASFDNAKSLAGIAAVAIIGFALDRGLLWLRSRAVFWQPDIVALG
jgi:ABC-type nitrate/sulfonate/bicarbonate transport system permease component